MLTSRLIDITQGEPSIGFIVLAANGVGRVGGGRQYLDGFSGRPYAAYTLPNIDSAQARKNSFYCAGDCMA